MDAKTKTVKLLENYALIKKSDGKRAKEAADMIEDAIKKIRENPYYEIIPMFYFCGYKREYIAKALKTSPSTVSRNKKKLVEKLAMIIFTDEAVDELLEK